MRPRRRRVRAVRRRRRRAHDQRQHRHRLPQPLVVREDPAAAVPAAVGIRASFPLQRPRQRASLVPEQRHLQRPGRWVDLVLLSLLLVLQPREDLVEILGLLRDVLRALGALGGEEMRERVWVFRVIVGVILGNLGAVVAGFSLDVTLRHRAPGEVVGDVVGTRGAPHAVRDVPSPSHDVPRADPVLDSFSRSAVVVVDGSAVAPLVARRGHLADVAVAHRARGPVRMAVVEGQRLAEGSRVRVIVQRAAELRRARHLHVVVAIVCTPPEIVAARGAGGGGPRGPRGPRDRRYRRRRRCRRGGECGARGYRALGVRGGVGGVPLEGLAIFSSRSSSGDASDLGEGVDALAHGHPVRGVLRH